MKLQFLVLLLAIPFAMAAPVTLVDSATGDEITAAFVRLETNGTAYDYLVTPGQGLDLGPIQDGGLLLVRTNSTTFDHYALLPPGQPPQGIPVHPGGLVMGEVRDTGDNLIVHAPIIISCPTYSGQVLADETGRFRAFLPAESCTLAVASEGRMGNATVLVEQGAVVQPIISVNRKPFMAPPQKADMPWFIVAIVLVAMLTISIIWFHQSRFKRRATTTTFATSGAPEHPFIADETKHVLKEKEKLIVDELVLRGGKMTVRELRFNTQLPRTSLLRTLEGLEARNILVKREEHGRLTVELLKK